MARFSLMPAGAGENYTGMLTRSIVFSATLIVFLVGTALTIAAIIVPNWISYDSYTDGAYIHRTYGLHKKCSNTAATFQALDLGTNLKCTDFPRFQDCHGENRYYCSMWRSVGFLMSFAVVVEGMTIAAFVILLLGGKQKREQGWPVLASLAGLSALVQVIGMALVTYLFDNDDGFFGIFDGWFLDKSWTMTTVSWAFQALCAASITLAAMYLPSEGGYELIPDFRHDDA